MFAKLVGEGYEKPTGDSELPLDVNYAKVSDWLVDRRLLPQDWNRKLQAIQSKASQLAKELPPGFLGQFTGGEDAPVDYFRSKEILAKLSETAERGLLGSLKGEAGSWERVVKAYEANMLHLAEAGLTLARNIDYEVPYFKKQAAKYQQTISDLERRQNDAQKSAAAAAADFKQECASLGLPPGTESGGVPALKAGLSGLTAELPELTEAAVKKVKNDKIDKALAYYAAFVAMNNSGGDVSSSSTQTVDGSSLLPILSEVKEGRTEASTDNNAAAVPAIETTEPELQWGDDLGNTADAILSTDSGAEPQLQWDLGGDNDVQNSSAVDGEGGGISWEFEIETTTAGGGGEEHDEQAPLGVSWDIDVSGQGEDSTLSEAAVLIDSSINTQALSSNLPSSTNASTAAAVLSSASPEVQRLCTDPAYRGKLLDDLHELRAFLRQRAAELAARGMDVVSSSVPEAVASFDVDNAKDTLAAVEAAISALTGEQFVRLVSLASSARYKERMLSSLVRRSGQEAKFQRAAADAASRAAEAQRQLVSDSARLATVLRHTREVKTAFETTLGSHLGRRVNVQGEINTVLAQQQQ